MKHCTLFVDLFGPCLQDGQEVQGAFDALKKLIELLGAENIYILGGLSEAKDVIFKNLHYFNFFKKTGILEENVVMFEHAFAHDAKFFAVTQSIKKKHEHVCVIDDDIQVLGRFPRTFLRVLLGYDQKEQRIFEKKVLERLSFEDTKKWDTLLIMPSWQIHFSILEKWVLDPESIL